MKTYTFYTKGISINVFDKDLLTPSKKKKLHKKGFQSTNFTIKAINEEDAFRKACEHFKKNTEALEEFSKDIAISSFIFGSINLL
ncbi:hypothetical protein MUA01_15750 [Enterobacteriaceae bacterium H18W14]|uniref:hypothetical protein n=1 Tax=Dryocola boscaweniae TaxID=2925397 RepID=UPI0022F12F81|nr:hypothetical protein [Dryocola boscaweniae]MCT4716417.1 hypothetical protein [Dryocola boscaweniae]